MSETSFRSVVHLFQHRVESSADREAMSGRHGGQWYSLTWRQAAERVRAVACGLLSLGLQKGDRAAILATSSPEWVIADLGILSAGGATSTIYTSNTAEESAYILENSGARFCFVENPVQEAKVREVKDQIGSVEHLILMDGAPVAPEANDGWTIP
ncbi:MAG: long-chain fatty acid--CoA ligase, partial [Acidobacteria bacterium]